MCVSLSHTSDASLMWPAFTPCRIDEGGLDGDLCATVTAGAKQAVAVVWPTAEKLKLLKELAKVCVCGCVVCALCVVVCWCS